jgi:hypothetical protein
VEEGIEVLGGTSVSSNIVYCVFDDDAKSSYAFCKNGGMCKVYISGDSELPHPGCRCPVEWTGDHCETPGEMGVVEMVDDFDAYGEGEGDDEDYSSPSDLEDEEYGGIIEDDFEEQDDDDDDDHETNVETEFDELGHSESTVITYCVVGNAESSTAYCLNEGVCRSYLPRGSEDKKHPGCVCPNLYSGSHCQVHVETGEQTVTFGSVDDYAIAGENAAYQDDDGPMEVLNGFTAYDTSAEDDDYTTESASGEKKESMAAFQMFMLILTLILLVTLLLFLARCVIPFCLRAVCFSTLRLSYRILKCSHTSNQENRLHLPQETQGQVGSRRIRMVY